MTVSARTPLAKSLSPRVAVLAAAVLLLVLGAAYGTVLRDLSRTWHANPSYSHGYLVPAFAVALLWMRRRQLRTQLLRPSLWCLPFLVAGLAFRHFSAHIFVDWFEQLSLLACLPGLVMAVGGWEGLRWSWPALAFLVFMIPLPYTLEVALQHPLQRFGTVASTYVMQTVGMPAMASGNLIEVYGRRINVAEACSGLRMLMIFVALSTAVAMLSQRVLWERLLIAASAIPIAIASNVLRIVVVGMVYAFGYDRIADLLHNELAPFLMMPFALVLLWGELLLLSRLIVEETVEPYGGVLSQVAGVGEQRLVDRKARAAGVM